MQQAFVLGQLYGYAITDHWAEIWQSDWETYVGNYPNNGPNSTKEADELINDLRGKIRELGLRT